MGSHDTKGYWFRVSMAKRLKCGAELRWSETVQASNEILALLRVANRHDLGWPNVLKVERVG